MDNRWLGIGVNLLLILMAALGAQQERMEEQVDEDPEVTLSAAVGRTTSKLKALSEDEKQMRDELSELRLA